MALAIVPVGNVSEKKKSSSITNILIVSSACRSLCSLDFLRFWVQIIADNVSSSATSRGLNPDNGVTGWELALVTAPSSNETAVASSKLVRVS